jgi:tryptophan synthase alpha chain
MFRRLAAEHRGAFVPFAVAGDPDPSTSVAVLDTLARSRSAALEVGLPFSDPVADGPAIQAAGRRALASGSKGDVAWRIIGRIRDRHPDLPIGLLVYANLVLHAGADRFYARAAEAGVDAVLVADAPLCESGPLERAAEAHGIAPVLIAPPGMQPGRLAEIAARSRGFVYVTSRDGVTGTHAGPQEETARTVHTLRAAGAAPALVGFGVSKPAHVALARRMGAAGAICGSAIARLIEEGRGDPQALMASLARFVEDMRDAAAGALPGEP